MEEAGDMFKISRRKFFTLCRVGLLIYLSQDTEC